jgi:chromosome condensin MukBEF complex kleisin-like MukF subunit
MGESQQAAEVANNVDSVLTAKNSWGQSEFDQAKAYDLARVYALCATASRENGALAEQYSERAMKHLRTAVEGGYFKEAARAQRLTEDRDLEFLRRREDFRELLHRVEPESH